MSEIVTEAMAARLIGVVPTTLARWRRAGNGPPCWQHPDDGSWIYDPRALFAWLENNTRSFEVLDILRDLDSEQQS